MTITETPLTSDQYITLRRGRHRTKWMVVRNPNTVMFAGQINQTSFGGSIPQFAYDSVTVGAYTDVKRGWTLFISHTSNIKEAYFRGRVRKLPTSGVIYVNQNSAPMQNNDHWWILKDTGLHECVPFKSGNVIYEDYDKPYTGIDPTDTTLPSFMVGRLTDAGPVELTFTPGTRANTSGATIVSHLWDADGGTIVGPDDEEDATIEFDAPGWYEVRHTFEDSGGRENFFACRVIIYPADYSEIIAKDLICDSLTCEMNVGWSAQIRATAGSDVVDLLNETELVVFSEDWFAGTRGSLITNAKFIGRLRKTNNSTSFNVQANAVRVTKQTQVEVEGIGAQLGRLILASVTLRRRDPATVLGEITNLTLWRGMQFLAQLTTLSTIHALTFDSTNNDYLYPIFTAQDRSAESALSDTAFTINAFFNWNPQGQIKIARHMWYLNSTDKAALTTIAAFQKRDYSGFTLPRDRVPRLGRIIAYGGTYNTTSATTLALRAKAPAVVWGPGEGRAQLNRQVLKANLSLAGAQSEMIVRTGAEFASKNLTNTLEIKHPSGYDNVLSPSVYQRYTWVIEADSNREGFACGTEKFWWLERVQVRYKPFDGMDGGRTETTASYVEDVTSANAQIIAEIAPDDRPAPMPSLPLLFSTPFTGFAGLQFPNGPDIDPEDEQPYTQQDAEATQKPPEKSTDPEKPTPIPAQHQPSRDGAVVAVSNGSGLWICEDFNVKSSPTWRTITPGSGLTDFKFDSYTGGGYAITNNGTNSFFWRADNILNPSWHSASVEGVYTQLRPAGNGVVVIYSPSLVGPGSESVDFLVDQQGWDGLYGGSGLYAVYIEDEGWARGTFNTRIAISKAFVDLTVTQISLTFNQAFTGHLNVINAAGSSGFDVIYDRSGITWTVTGLSLTDGVGFNIYDDALIVPADLRLVACTVIVTGGGSSAVVRVSEDYGATFDEPIIAGDPTDDAAAMTFGSGIYAATADKVRGATIGGAFSDVPGGGTTGTYALALWPYGAGILMAPAAAISSETLFIVDGAATSITPNDGSNDGVVVGNNGLTTSPNALLFVGNFGGSVKLARSDDAGSSWDFSALNAGAKAVRAKNDEQIYIADGDTLRYSEDAATTLVTRASPASGLILLEVR